MRSFLKFYRLLRGGAVLRGTAVTRQSIIVIQYFGYSTDEELFCKMATRQRFVHFFLHKLTFLLPVVVSEQSVFLNRKSFHFLRFSLKNILKIFKIKILNFEFLKKIVIFGILSKSMEINENQ